MKAYGVAEQKPVRSRFFFQIYNFLRHIALTSVSINLVFHPFWVIFGKIGTERVPLFSKSLLQVKKLRLSIWVLSSKTNVEEIISACPVLAFTETCYFPSIYCMYIWGHTVLRYNFLQFPLDYCSIENETQH